MVRRIIGLTGQYATLDEELTGLGNLILIGRLLDLRKREASRRAAELLERFGLTDAAKKPVATYSGGMRRRLDLAASLVGRPRVVFLDEPSVGLDPGKREELWQIIRELTADGASVLLTTQYLEEADALADEITVIDHGRVIAHGTPPELKQIVGGQAIATRPKNPGDVERAAAILAAVSGHPVERTAQHELITPVDGDGRCSTSPIALKRKGLRLPSSRYGSPALTRCSSPSPEHPPLLGSIMADMVRYIIAIALLFGIGYLMGFRIQTDAGSSLAAVVLVLAFGFCLSWVTVFLGVLVKDEGAVMAFAFIVFIPLMLGSSLAAPLDTLPAWLQAWANINPVTHAMDAARALLAGAPAGDSIVQTIIWSVGILIVFCPLAIVSYSRKR